MRTDPHYGPYATEEVVERNRRLVGVWDALSLAMCFGRKLPQSWQQVTLVVERRYLAATFSNESKMSEALSHAPWVTSQTVLFPNQTE